MVHIYYEESFFRSHTKEELIGFTEFLCKYNENGDNTLFTDKIFFLQLARAVCWGCLWALVSYQSLK